MSDIDIKSLVSRLDETCSRALNAGAGLCVSRGNYEVSVEHMIHALLDDPYADVASILTHFGVDKGRVHKEVAAAMDSLRSGNPGRPVFSPILVSWLKESWLQASLALGHDRIRSGVLLLTLLDNFGRFAGGDYHDVLAGVSLAELRENYADIVADSTEDDEFRAPGSGAAPGEAAGREGDSALAKFCIDFTARARDGHIDPIFGRDREIRQMVDILARRRKNNPIVVGEAGVGKTALIEGLALRVVAGDVPDLIADVDILSLDMGLLQAGASVKGEFENRLKAVIDEVKASPKPIIMFIDEAHTLIGAGGQAGGGDAANLLKPALARGELRTIAATTWSEYKKYFEKDPALARRFQPIKVEEPSTEGAATMLRGLRQKYEESHGVFVRDDAVAAAAEMGSRYISGRQHPDKGVDLLDTAAARVKVSLTSKPGVLEDLTRKVETDERELASHRRDRDNGAADRDERITELEAEIETTNTRAEEVAVRWEKEKSAAQLVIEAREALAAAQEAEDGDAAAAAAQLRSALDALHAAQGEDPMVHAEVTPEVVSQVIADWTGIPLGNMVKDEASTLLKFEDQMVTRIKGQDHVMEIVGEGIRAAKAGLTDPRTPHGVFLFVGPSGVGKTETATGVADLLYGGERFMTVINMSEFQEKHTVSRLIGSPPGYVGYGEGGVLTEAVRQRPYPVVLLDEVEKADPEVLNLFYQVFDKGDLSDGEGRQIDFANTVIFLTSNLATDLLTQAGLRDPKPSVEELVAEIRPILSKHFKPALLARMTIVPFFPLHGDVMKDIARLKLGKVEKRLQASHKIAMAVDDAVVDAIAARCTEVETGARNVDHIINGTLLPGISREILGQMSAGEMPTTLRVGLGDDGSFAFAFGHD